MHTHATRLIITLGDGLAVKLTEDMALAARVVNGTWALVSIEPGRIVIEARAHLAMARALEAFNPELHGGEVMAGAPGGVEFASPREALTKRPLDARGSAS